MLLLHIFDWCDIINGAYFESRIRKQNDEFSSENDMERQEVVLLHREVTGHLQQNSRVMIRIRGLK
jgi:hypothetical protein